MATERIRADQLRVGDWLVPEYGPGYKEPISEVWRGWRRVEVTVGGEDYPDPMGQPGLVFRPDEKVKVKR